MNEDHWPERILDEIEWFHFQVILKHISFHAKGETMLICSLLKVFHMYSMGLWENEQFHSDELSIKCNNSDRTVKIQLKN